MVVEIEPITDTELVKVHISMERVIENISSSPVDMPIIFALDEWSFAEHKSHIEYCRFDVGNGQEDCTDKDHDDSVIEKQKLISLGAGKKVKTASKGYEIHRDNGTLIGFNVHTAKNPIVTVRAPVGFKLGCSFGVPNENWSHRKLISHIA
jgi:hypothetical protein